jgi:alanine racemase
MPDQVELLVKHKLTASVCTHDQLNALRRAAHQLNTRALAVVKIDTGMHRIGLKPSQLLPFIRDMLTYPGIEVRGVFTHLATADAADKTFANAQLELFTQAVSKVTAAGIALPFISAANSATIIDLPQGHFNTVRAGIIMYGLPPSATMQQHLNLQPALQWKTKIVYIKQIQAGDSVSYGATYRATGPTYIATLPVGYADGYFRQLSSHSNVLIGGKRRPVVGRICMDQLMVDLGPVCDANIGDEAVLIGKQGQAVITADEIADLAGTINYEVVCAISARVPRTYIN